jgi:protein-L-isoaspartate(D-aspartate) O-methyltransferase
MTAETLEAKAEFLFRLRSRGIRDLAVLRAIEAVPRHSFVPHRYADLATRDVALPLPCGQTMTHPFLVARMLDALEVAPDARVLEIGSGSGYVTALLARLGREVLGVERFRTLAQGARTRVSALDLAHATIVWGDGLAVPADRGPFDRILVHGELAEVPAELDDLLAEDGIMVFARRPEPGSRQDLVQARRGDDGPWGFTAVAPSRLRPLYDGASQGL